jgi:hypothetical protein
VARVAGVNSEKIRMSGRAQNQRVGACPAAAAHLEALMGEPSGLSDFGVQSDKTVSRETFWYD